MPEQEKLRKALLQEALRMQVRREHSRQELVIKLQRKLADWLSATPDDSVEADRLVEAVLDGLGARKLQSDQRFAQQRVAHRGARYGNQRLQYELGRQGVAEETIEQALATGEDELSRCRAVWQKKFGVLPTGREEMAKQVRFLQYRGFSGATIRQVLKPSPDELIFDES